MIVCTTWSPVESIRADAGRKIVYPDVVHSW